MTIPEVAVATEIRHRLAIRNPTVKTRMARGAVKYIQDAAINIDSVPFNVRPLSTQPSREPAELSALEWRGREQN